MRILYIHQYFCTRAGRSGTRSYEFARHLVRHGHQVTMLTSISDLSDLRLDPNRRVQRLRLEGIEVVVVGAKYSQQLSTFGRMCSFAAFVLLASWFGCRLGGHDVVIATSTPLTVSIPGMLASLRWRIPLVFEVRDLWPEAPIQMGVVRSRALIAVLRWLERLTYRRSTQVITLSPGMRAGVLAAGTPPEKVTVIPNCSDLDLFQPGPPDPARVAQYGLEGRFVAVHAGSMGSANAVDVIVGAAAELQAKGASHVKVLLVGEGKLGPTMQARVQELGLRNVVFTGSVPRHDVPEFLRLANVALITVKNLPVMATTSPNKLFDALAAGLPLIVNSNDWMRDLVQRHDVGLWAEAGSAQSLAEQILWLAANPSAAEKMGRNARRVAEDRFDRQKLAAEFERVLLAASGQEAAEPPPSEAELDPRLRGETVRESAPGIAANAFRPDENFLGTRPAAADGSPDQYAADREVATGPQAPTRPRNDAVAGQDSGRGVQALPAA